MPLAFLLANISLVWAIISILYPREALPLLLPYIDALHPLIWIILFLIGSFLLILKADLRQRDVKKSPLLELVLLFFPIFIFVWAVMSPGLDNWGFLDVAICALIFIVYARSIMADRKNISAWGINKTHFLPALKLLWIPTTLCLAVTVCWIIIIGNPVSYSHILLSLVTYPFYAAAQLLIFLSFPMVCFHKLRQPALSTRLAVAGLFALIHWPNMILVAACFVAMFFWSWVYLRHPNLFAVAVSMGIVAAVFGQGLPASVHHNLRVGPFKVYKQLLKLPPETVFDSRIQQAKAFVSSQNHVSSVDHLNQVLNGRELSEYSRSIWTDFEKKWGLEGMIKGFMRGAEMRQQWHNVLDWPTRGYQSKRIRPQYYGYLDNLDMKSTGTVIIGWIADVKEGLPADSVHVFINGKHVHAAPPNARRKDVSTVFGISSKPKYGFNYTLASPSDMDIRDLRIFAFGQDGNPYEIFYPRDYKWLNLYANH